jgi:hypothetical protein
LYWRKNIFFRFRRRLHGSLLTFFRKIAEKIINSIVDWRKKTQALASAQIIIQEELDNAPYTPVEYEEKCAIAFQHVYDYYGKK